MPEVMSQRCAEYVQAFSDRKIFSFVRYGDGEIANVLGHRGANTNGCEYTDYGRKLLQGCIKHQYGENFIYATWAHFEYSFSDEFDRWLAENEIHIAWHRANPFHRASRDGTIKKLFVQLRRMKVLVVGPAFLYRIRHVFPVHGFISVPPKNALLEVDRVYERCRADIARAQPEIVVFCTGLSANVLIDRLWSEFGQDVFLIDFGSVFDPYCGRLSRRYMTRDSFQQARHNNLPEGVSLGQVIG